MLAENKYRCSNPVFTGAGFEYPPVSEFRVHDSVSSSLRAWDSNSNWMPQPSQDSGKRLLALDARCHARYYLCRQAFRFGRDFPSCCLPVKKSQARDNCEMNSASFTNAGRATPDRQNCNNDQTRVCMNRHRILDPFGLPFLSTDTDSSCSDSRLLIFGLANQSSCILAMFRNRFNVQLPQRPSAKYRSFENEDEEPTEALELTSIPEFCGRKIAGVSTVCRLSRWNKTK